MKLIDADKLCASMKKTLFFAEETGQKKLANAITDVLIPAVNSEPEITTIRGYKISTLVMVADLLIRGEVQPQDLDNYTDGLQQGYKMAFTAFHRGLKLIAKELTGEAEE